jgi:hypothetical protein
MVLLLSCGGWVRRGREGQPVRRAIDAVTNSEGGQQLGQDAPNAGGNFEFEVTLELVRRSPRVR